MKSSLHKMAACRQGRQLYRDTQTVSTCDLLQQSSDARQFKRYTKPSNPIILKDRSVHSLELVITVAFAMTIIGLAAGYLIALRAAPSRQSQRQLEEHLNDMKQQQESYQSEVSEHFVETADLLNQLTTSYRDVHNHLAKGAQLLAGDNAKETLKALEGASETPVIVAEGDTITPPLDYAPKTAPNEPGMLNEEFGLDKKARQEKIDVMITAEDRM